MKNNLVISTFVALASATTILPITNIKAASPQEAPSSISPSPSVLPSQTPVNASSSPSSLDSSNQQTPPKHSAYRGFSISAWQAGQGSNIKQKSHWISAFSRIKTIGNDFHAVRTYATQEDGTRLLPDILAAANETDTDVLVGLYLGDNDGGARFNTEFQVLKDAVAQYGLGNIIGITVGNEDLYRATTPPALIASQISQVQSYLDTAHRSNCIPVGHVDTWNALFNSSASTVANTSDFLVANIFPYWENSTLATAPAFFKNAIDNITSYEASHDIDIWIGETGWPMSAPLNTMASFQGVPGQESMQRYWNEIVCSDEFMGRNAFYYIDYDGGDQPGWGVFGDDGNPRIGVECGPV